MNAKKRTFDNKQQNSNESGTIIDIQGRHYVQTKDGRTYYLPDTFQKNFKLNAQVKFRARSCQTVQTVRIDQTAKAQEKSKQGQKSGIDYAAFKKYIAEQVSKRKQDYDNCTPPPESSGQFDQDELGVFENYGLPIEFSPEALYQAEQVASEPIDNQLNKRTDLRDMQIITIDPATAKDLDDGVSYQVLENDNILLGVHIADVAHYVREGTQLYKEAFERGTSTYIPNKVVPMLPHTLSSGVCSLTEGNDRLALSTFMEIDKHGNVISHEIMESIINVAKRFSYDEVTLLLNDGPTHLGSELSDIEYLPLLQDIANITRTISTKRKERGEIAFDNPEAKITKNKETGEIENIEAYPCDESHQMIATSMILCNETIASHLENLPLPNIYRTHKEPSAKKAHDLVTLLDTFGIPHNLDPNEIDDNEIADIINNLDDETRKIISSEAIACMQKAFYSHINEGHYGLGSNAYSHTTSPIRRFPDLFTQHIVKDILLKDQFLSQEEMSSLNQKAEHVARYSTFNEMRADKIENEINELNTLKFMETQIGNVFEGHVTNITKKNISVILQNTIRGKLITENEGYKPGQKLTMQVVGVNMSDKQIKFKPAEQVSENVISKLDELMNPNPIEEREPTDQDMLRIMHEYTFDEIHNQRHTDEIESEPA